MYPLSGLLQKLEGVMSMAWNYRKKKGRRVLWLRELDATLELTYIPTTATKFLHDTSQVTSGL